VSPRESVEELLTETLKRAGERAVPDQLYLPFQSDDHVRDRYEPRWDRAGGRSARFWRIAATGIAALVLVAVGMAALLHSSPSITLERTQLSAAQAQRLLCGAPGCVPVVHDATGLPSPSAAGDAGPAYGNFQITPSRAPLGTWIVANNGEFERVIARSVGTNSTSGSKSATVYLSAGGGRYYQFAIPDEDRPPRVIGHSTHEVTLKGSNGERYVLDLRTSELLARQ
jgi:hypothetical protein